MDYRSTAEVPQDVRENTEFTFVTIDALPEGITRVSYDGKIVIVDDSNEKPKFPRILTRGRHQHIPLYVTYHEVNLLGEIVSVTRCV